MSQLTARVHCAQAVATALWDIRFVGRFCETPFLKMRNTRRLTQTPYSHACENLLGEASEAAKMTIHFRLSRMTSRPLNHG
jgi:hypothetical protein